MNYYIKTVKKACSRLLLLNDQLAKQYASRFEEDVLEVIPEEIVKAGEPHGNHSFFLALCSQL